MKLQFNTDKNIQGTEVLEAMVTEKLNHDLRHFADKITRIEVHLSDQNAEKSGPDDIQCKLEARLEGRQPVLVTGSSASKEKAVDDAIDKLKATLTTILGKMRNN